MTDVEALLIQQEALRLRPYDDATGKPLLPGDTLIGKLTVGVGRNLSDTDLSEDEWKMFLARDVASATRDVRVLCPVYDDLSRPRQLVLLSLAFNLGRNRLSLFRRFLSAVELGHYDDAADELLDSRAAKQAPERYQQLAWMMRKDTV